MADPLSPDDYLAVLRVAKLISVDLVLENSQGQVLLGFRQNKPAQNSWFVPGGAVRKDETIPQALSRVSLSELGLSIDQTQFFALAHHHYPDNFKGEEGTTTHYIVLAHRLILPPDAILRPDTQHRDLKWFSKKTLLKQENVHPFTKAYFAPEPPSEIIHFRR